MLLKKWACIVCLKMVKAAVGPDLYHQQEQNILVYKGPLGTGGYSGAVDQRHPASTQDFTEHVPWLSKPVSGFET